MERRPRAIGPAALRLKTEIMREVHELLTMHAAVPPPVLVRLADGATLPWRAYASDAGFDLTVHGLPDGRAPLQPGQRMWLPTGVRLCIPDGWACRIVSRSSTYRKHGLEIYEGLIDAGYQGELQVAVMNRTDQPFVIRDGARLAQIVFFRCAAPLLHVVTEFPETTRGEAGFGSSGS